MPKLISFDVGIKNLAYCIFDIDIDNQKCKILDWNVLDISKEAPSTSSVSPDIFCSCFLSKKTKKCTKKAKYQKENEYYCEVHAKSSGFLLPLKKFSHSSLKKISLEKLLEIEKEYFPNSLLPSPIDNCKKKETKIEKIERIHQQFKEKCLAILNPIPKENTGVVDLIKIGRNLANQLNNLDLENVEYVLIENQISPIANKMKTIQGMIAQIFIIQNVPNIEFISSINKLRGFTSLENERKIDIEEKKEKTTKNPNYKQHKKNGISYCQQWLKNDFFCSWCLFFEEFRNKQDDLADCFLQGIWYLKKMNILTEKMNILTEKNGILKKEEEDQKEREI